MAVVKQAARRQARAGRQVVPDDMKTVQTFIGGSSAGVFGSIFNTPGDVIRSAIQKEVLAAPGQRVPFSVGMMAGGVSQFFRVGGQIVAAKGLGGLWTGFPFKAMHLGGSGALLAILIPFFKERMGVSME